MSDHGPAPGVQAWKKRTTAFDRVQSIAQTLSEPQSLEYIATEAHVSESTAQGYLDQLVGLTVLMTHDDEGTTKYAPDPLYTRLQTLRDLLDTHDHDSLTVLKTELEDEIDALQTEYGVSTPEELRDHATQMSGDSEPKDIPPAIRKWELISYRLSIVKEALENYATYNRDVRISEE